MGSDENIKQVFNSTLIKKIIEELPVEYSAVLLPDFCFTEKSFGLISKLWKKVLPLPKFLYLFVRKEEPVNFFISINVFHAMALEQCVIDAFHKLSNNDETILTNEWFEKFHAYYWKIIFKRLNELPNVKRCEAKLKAAYFLFNNMPMPVSPSCHCGLLQILNRLPLESLDLIDTKKFVLTLYPKTVDWFSATIPTHTSKEIVHLCDVHFELLCESALDYLIYLKNIEDISIEDLNNNEKLKEVKAKFDLDFDTDCFFKEFNVNPVTDFISFRNLGDLVFSEISCDRHDFKRENTNRTASTENTASQNVELKSSEVSKDTQQVLLSIATKKQFEGSHISTHFSVLLDAPFKLDYSDFYDHESDIDYWKDCVFLICFFDEDTKQSFQKLINDLSKDIKQTLIKNSFCDSSTLSFCQSLATEIYDDVRFILLCYLSVWMRSRRGEEIAKKIRDKEINNYNKSNLKFNLLNILLKENSHNVKALADFLSLETSRISDMTIKSGIEINRDLIEKETKPCIYAFADAISQSWQSLFDTARKAEHPKNTQELIRRAEEDLKKLV